MAKLDELIQKLQAQNTPYTALTNEQMQQQAKNRFQSTYDQKRLTAQQEHDTQAAALDRQMAQLQSDYDRKRTDTAAQYRQTYAQTNRAALGRGMQRASYTNAALANVDQAGLRAQQDITDAQTASENQIGEQKATLAQTLASQMSEYNLAQQGDELDYQDKLEEREYGRLTDSQNTQRELATKIYEYQHQLEVEEEERRRWEAEFALQKAMAGM